MFHAPQEGIDPPRLGAHTHQPIDHAHQEANQDTAANLLQTPSSPNYILKVLLLTVKSMHVKMFEISTPNCLYFHIVLVYLLYCVQPDDGHHDGRNM